MKGLYENTRLFLKILHLAKWEFLCFGFSIPSHSHFLFLLWPFSHVAHSRLSSRNLTVCNKVRSVLQSLNSERENGDIKKICLSL